jgi:hypothetical protein
MVNSIGMGRRSDSVPKRLDFTLEDFARSSGASEGEPVPLHFEKRLKRL